ncbi:MAG: hypothetical protein ABSC57_03670, partial [Syntrophales bacterium]
MNRDGGKNESEPQKVCLIPPPLGNGSTWQGNRSPMVIRATSIPYACRIYFHIYGIALPSRPDVAASYAVAVREAGTLP